MNEECLEQFRANAYEKVRQQVVKEDQQVVLDAIEEAIKELTLDECLGFGGGIFYDL